MLKNNVDSHFKTEQNNLMFKYLYFYVVRNFMKISMAPFVAIVCPIIYILVSIHYFDK